MTVWKTSEGERGGDGRREGSMKGRKEMRKNGRRKRVYIELCKNTHSLFNIQKPIK